MTKYKFGEYVLTSGWGGAGIYDASLVIGQEDDGRDRIPEHAVIVGNGSGYEEFRMDEDFCKKVTDLMNLQETNNIIKVEDS